MRRGRERRDERQDERRGGGPICYQMRQEMASIGDDLWIENGYNQIGNGPELDIQGNVLGHEYHVKSSW